VFEDAVPDVEAVRRAGVQVVWCPLPDCWTNTKAGEANPRWHYGSAQR
jgi:hypothetical protein